MFILGHLAAGYLTAKAVTLGVASELSVSEVHHIGVLGALFGVLPDFDFIPYFIRGRSMELRSETSHRDYVSHAPSLWCFAGLVLSILGTFAASLFWSITGVVVWLSSWSHFLLDTVGGRVMWLWPFTRKRFGMELAPDDMFVKNTNESALAYYLRLFRTVYVLHPIFWIEVALVVTALVLMV